MASLQCLAGLKRDSRLSSFIVKGQATGRRLSDGLYGSAEEVKLIILTEFTIIYLCYNNIILE